jgi:hypothetical protein
MSAAVDWDLAPSPCRMPSRTARPPLRLVGPEERVIAPVMRISRRGRLLITVAVSIACVSLAVVLATSVGAAAPQIGHAITISAGQTLSQVAADQLPSLPVNEAVIRIQLANGLDSSQVQEGQILVIPATP